MIELTRACTCCAFLVIIAVLGPARPAHAQNTGALLLQFLIDARGIGMGEAGAADNSHPGNAFFNPANIVGHPRVYAMGSQYEINFFDELPLDAYRAGGSWAPGPDAAWTFSGDLSYGRLDYGPSALTTSEGAPLGEFDMMEDYVALSLGAGFATEGPLEIRMAGAVKRWQADFKTVDAADNVVDADADAIAFDVGTTIVYTVTREGWTASPALGVALVNAGPDIEWESFGESDPLPTRFHLGVSIKAASPTVSRWETELPMITTVFNVDLIQRHHDDPESMGIGAEMALLDMIFVRVGMHEFDDDTDGLVLSDRPTWGLGLGIPVGPVRARFDYASQAQFDQDHYGLFIAWEL